MLFVFIVVSLFLLFAAIHDWKTTFVSDWLVYALAAFLVSYVGFQALEQQTWAPMTVASYGLLVFSVLAGVLYSSRLFAAGDAWLLAVLGMALADSLEGFFVRGAFFFLLVIGIGGAYTIGMTFLFAFRAREKWWREIYAGCERLRWYWWGSVLVGLISAFMLDDEFLWTFSISILFLGGLLYVHARAVDRVCMMVRRKPADLLVGDWLVADVRVRGTVIHATHQGLTVREIQLLRNAKKSVIIRQGIPFVPVFFVSYIIMVYAVSVGLDFDWMLRLASW